MFFPRVKKSFGRLGSGERLTKATVKVVGAAMLAAGLNAAAAPEATARIVGPATEAQAASSNAGHVIVLPAAPAVSISDGTRLAVHSSHVSHASHTSHGSHCSSYSYC